MLIIETQKIYQLGDDSHLAARMPMAFLNHIPHKGIFAIFVIYTP